MTTMKKERLARRLVQQTSKEHIVVCSRVGTCNRVAVTGIESGYILK